MSNSSYVADISEIISAEFSVKSKLPLKCSDKYSKYML